MNTVNITENTLSAWAVLEHVRTVKRWHKEDLEWIKMAQDLSRESLIALVGNERAMKMIANSRIALRKKQDDMKQQRAAESKDEAEQIEASPEVDQAIIKGYSY